MGRAVESRLYHLVPVEEWSEAVGIGHYPWSTRGLTLAEVGFVHLCFADQVAAVRERFYADLGDGVLLLEIDPARLRPELRVEVDPGTGEEFPHLYGGLDLDAVVGVSDPGKYPRAVHVWRSLDEVPADPGRSVVVIGNFDGVHLGHQHVIGRAREDADRLGARLVAVTFDPHPIAVLRPEHAPQTLTDLDHRCRLLADAGADDVLVIPFSREIAAWSPEEFVRRVLVDRLQAQMVVVGANFRFGARAAGDVAFLAEAGSRYDFGVDGIALDGGPQVWSSTYVRTCLAAGDVEGAAEALGRPYRVEGTVVRGDQRGRELGFPTANVPVGVLAVPADGVYAGRLRVVGEQEWLPAAISIGTNPTFAGERARRVEAYVLDRDDLDLYDRPVEITFVSRIRGMKRFDGVEELLAAMAQDVERARTLLG